MNQQNINVMMNELKETNWNEILNGEDVNVMYNTFTEKLTKIYNTTCPIVKQKIVNKRPDKPWMTNSLKQACKNLLNRQFLKKRSITSEENIYKNKLTGILRYCEKQHYTELLEKKQGKHKRNMENTK